MAYSAKEKAIRHRAGSQLSFQNVPFNVLVSTTAVAADFLPDVETEVAWVVFLLFAAIFQKIDAAKVVRTCA